MIKNLHCLFCFLVELSICAMEDMMSFLDVLNARIEVVYLKAYKSKCKITLSCNNVIGSIFTFEKVFDHVQVLDALKIVIIINGAIHWILIVHIIF
jgi:hypothetical protein